MEGSPYRKFSFFQGKMAVLGTGPGELHCGEQGFLLAGTQRPVSCLGSGGIQYLSIFPQHVGSYSPYLDYLIGSFPPGGEFPCWFLFGVVAYSSQNPILVYLVFVLLYENLVVVLVVVYRSLLLQMPPASPIEDRGTAIPIEDRDRAIPERLRLCGVIVKGLPVSLMWRKNDSVGS
ncbi:hypothetical protein F2Q69_00006884 [Brassica cretica]|uniref:Uncharacterized protein n=1 Tax=Brassica cretica TaxID=69181 RepID=A0A8S9PK31_BRACR|nr:hypothetical protein F2Q69_00006884 [Brassica cretica]